MSPYEQRLAALREVFPPPVVGPGQWGGVSPLLRALGDIEVLRTPAASVNVPNGPGYAELANAPQPLSEVVPELVRTLGDMLAPGHPHSQVNVVAPPSLASVIGVLLPSLYNPNLCSDDSGRGFAAAELRVISIVSRLIGYEPNTAGGLFTFGGTGTLLYGIKIGLEKALPGTLQNGGAERACVLASDHSHHAVTSVCGWLGIGQRNVLRVPTHRDNSVDVAALAIAAREAVAAGRHIAAIVATLGTTDAFGLDDLAAIHQLRGQLVDEFQLDYRPHIHADAVIGWAWSVFTDYDFAGNPLGFRDGTVRSLAAAMQRIGHLGLADSLGVDFHKTGFAPYISSLFLARDRGDFRTLLRDREAMPYLNHSEQQHPGTFSLETSRPATGVLAALANLLLLGCAGLQTLIGHAVEMAELLRELASAQRELAVVNSENCGPVTLLRAYPPGTEADAALAREQTDPGCRDQVRQNNRLNRLIYERITADALAGRGVALGYTDNYRLAPCGEPIAALKSFVLSPFATPEQMQGVVAHVLAARRAIVHSQ